MVTEDFMEKYDNLPELIMKKELEISQSDREIDIIVNNIGYIKSKVMQEITQEKDETGKFVFTNEKARDAEKDIKLRQHFAFSDEQSKFNEWKIKNEIQKAEHRMLINQFKVYTEKLRYATAVEGLKR
ncbi:MAG: hypothetical protein Q8P15_04090 [Nanoarchaeota archaeon]|nr:hypothetical protein [Nanoarchaeota archaeon]